jgi:anti-sigma regulatory factor (Ser/Thr protein kinase)
MCGPADPRDTDLDGRWFLMLPARPWAAEVFRTRLGLWLEAQAWPVDQFVAIVTAVNEAVTNSIEHAYPPREVAGASPVDDEGVVSVEVTVLYIVDTGTRRLWVVVHDGGSWDPLGEVTMQGTGLRVARELMDELSVHRGGFDAPVEPPGTVVTMLTPAVPLPAFP